MWKNLATRRPYREWQLIQCDTEDLYTLIECINIRSMQHATVDKLTSHKMLKIDLMSDFIKNVVLREC